MDLRQLEIVRAIAETGSFTGAGTRLHVSQSAISRQILLLEDEFHERLFVLHKPNVRAVRTFLVPPPVRYHDVWIESDE